MKKETFIYGIRPVMEAITAGKEMEKIFLQNKLKGDGFRELFNLVRELGIPFQFVPAEKLNRLSKQNHQGVIAFVAEITYHRIEDLVPLAYEQGRVPLFLVLDQVSDVRNLGAIARTAECAGVDGLVVPARGSAMINSDAIKTSAGALYKIPVVRSVHPHDTVKFLKESGLAVVAATEKAALPYTGAVYDRPVAIVMGSEGQGISGELLELADEQVRIPLQGEIESLNVSVAAGVILY